MGWAVVPQSRDDTHITVIPGLPRNPGCGAQGATSVSWLGIAPQPNRRFAKLIG